MNFGLGLVLSFTDNATAGINNAVNTLSNLTSTAESASRSLDSTASLSALSVVSGRLGSSFTSMGSTILSTLSQIIGKVNETGTTMLQAENQLGKLYEGSGKTGKDVLADIQTYARQSIFNFEDLIPVVTMLKANGIEAFDKIASSTGKANQTLMDYAADLAAFNPQMRNAYGTGIQAAMGALNEYIAEGNAMSLKRGASLDITALLGEDKGKTIEERSRQVADLMEKLNMVGMTAQLAGTPMQRLANMEDVLFDVTSRIASSGVYDEFSRIIEKISDYVFAIPDKELDTIAKTIGGALSTIMKPVEKAIDLLLSLCDVIRDLISNNPALAKFAVVGTAIGGALLVLVGVSLKATSALSGLSLVLLTFGKSFSDLGGILKKGALKIMSVLLPLAVAISLLRIGWKNDFAGIRTNTVYFVSNVKSSFATARDAVSGSVQDMTTTLNNLKSKGDFFSNLTIGMMQVMIVAQALKEGWDDFTLSEDTFLKAKELGVLPLIEALFILKYDFDNFKAGFIQGWLDIGAKIKKVIEGVASKCKGTIFQELIDKATEFFDKLGSSDADAWYEFGYSFAEFTAKAIAFALALKGVEKVLSIISTVSTLLSTLSSIGSGVISVVSTIGSTFARVFPNIASIMEGALNAIIIFVDLLKSGFTVAESLEIALGACFSPLAGIVALATGAITAVASFLSMLSNGFSWVKEALMLLGIAIAAVGAIILGVPATIAGVVAGVVAVVATIVVIVKQHWEEIKSFFAGIATWINDNVLQPVLNFMSPVIDTVKGLWEQIKETVQGVVDRVKQFIDDLGAGLQSMKDNFMEAIQPSIDTFNELKDTFLEFCEFIKNGISEAWENIKPVLESIKEGFTTAFNFIKDLVTKIWNGIWGVVGPTLISMWEGIKNIFLGIFDTIMNILTSIWNGIVGIFNGIVTFIVSIFGGIFRTISNVLMAIMNFIMGKTDEAKQNVKDAFGAVWSIITGMLKGIQQTVFGALSAVWGTIKSILNGVFDTFSNIFSSVVNIVSTKFTAIKDTISSIFNGAWDIIKGIVDKIKGVFDFKWKLPELKLPHVSVDGGEAPFGIAGKGSLPKFSIDWYAKGGVFDKPSVIGVGEAGREAVMPLENNTAWIGSLADMITSKMGQKPDMTPVSSMSSTNNTVNNGGNSYMTTSNATTNNTKNDNSVTFGTGSIQINIKDASEEEALKVAKYVMKYIKRQTEIDSMMQYN